MVDLENVTSLQTVTAFKQNLINEYLEQGTHGINTRDLAINHVSTINSSGNILTPSNNSTINAVNITGRATGFRISGGTTTSVTLTVDGDKAISALANKTDVATHTTNAAIHFTTGAISITESQISNLDKYSTSQVQAILTSYSTTDAINTKFSTYSTTGAINTMLTNYATTGALTIHTGNTAIHYPMSSISITETQISDLGDYVPEATVDDIIYGRKNGGWVQVYGGSGTTTSLAWGSIIGTLSNQTDLQNALNAKVATTVLTSYSTTDAITAMLNSYATTGALSIYSTTGAINTMLTAYTTTGALNTALTAYKGTNNVTNVGTVTVGTWSATAVGVTKGGTGLTTAAKGNLIVGNGTNTFAALAVGTNNYILTADTTQATGMKWAAAPTATLG